MILNHPQIPAILADPDDEGYTPLHLAVSLGHFETTEKILSNQNQGIDISTTTKEGKIIIHLAAISNDANVLALLLEIPKCFEPN